MEEKNLITCNTYTELQSLMNCRGNTPTQFFDEQLPFHCSFMSTIVG